MHVRNARGYTLVELLVVMAIMVTIMIVTANSFKNVVYNAGEQSKSAETQIQGIVGLELLRADLQQAGFGLPWSFPGAGTLAYQEATQDSNDVPSGVWGAASPPGPATSWVKYFNDAPNPPRAVMDAETAFNQDSGGHGSKYLVIKSTVVGAVADPGAPAGSTPAAKKWTTVSYAKGTHTARIWADPDRDFRANDRVIVVKDSLITTPPTQQLAVDGAGSFFRTFNNYSTLITSHQDGDTFEVYGVHPTSDLTMPFNRADYYVTTPATGVPVGCAPNTGVLYKSVLNQANGQLSPGTALLDCVADLQVVFGMDTSAQGAINDHVAHLDPLLTAQDIRNQVKEIRLYILSHEGKRDITYTHPSRYITVGEDFGGGVRGRVFDLQQLIGSDWNHYRWKVYTIVSRPKNLIQ